MKWTLIPIFLFIAALAQANDCTYEFDLENSVIEGTGFKYTEKTGVTGSFTGFKLNKNEKKKSFKELLKDLEVTVDLMTLDSGNALRDRNLRETLFSNIIGDSVIVVKVKEASDKKIKTQFLLNSQSQDVNFDYKLNNDLVTATGQFDISQFSMKDQVSSLEKRCGSLHTGSDGKSVTWTTFDLKLTAKLKKHCKK